MQTLTHLGQFSRGEVNALLLGVRALLLGVSARPIRLQLFFERLDGVSEIGQLAGDAGDVLVVRHGPGFYAGASRLCAVKQCT